jgi:imidazolonepropionase-like amidohydrolase
MTSLLSKHLLSLAVCTLVLLPATQGFAESPSRLIRAQHVHTMNGETMSPGAVLIEDGKIKLIQPSIDVDESVETIDVEHLMPGLVDAYAQISSAGSDAEQTSEVTPGFKTLRGVDWTSRQFLELLDEGITTAHILPGTDNVIAGMSAVVHTMPVGEELEPSILNDALGLVVSICRDPSSGNRARGRPDSIYMRQPTNRMGVVWIVRNALQQASVKDDKDNLLAKALNGDIPVFCVSRTEVDISSSLQLASDFNFKPTIFDAAEAYRLTDQISDAGTPVVVTTVPTSSDNNALRGPEGTELRWNSLGKLHNAEIPFAIAGGNLLDKARFAVRFGLPAEVALSAITSSPASILGVDDQVGSIRVGQPADLIGFDRDPLSFAASMNLRMIKGESIEIPEHSLVSQAESANE